MSDIFFKNLIVKSAIHFFREERNTRVLNASKFEQLGKPVGISEPWLWSGAGEYRSVICLWIVFIGSACTNGQKICAGAGVLLLSPAQALTLVSLQSAHAQSSSKRSPDYHGSASYIWTYFYQTELCALRREPCYACTLMSLRVHVLMHLVPFDRNASIYMSPPRCRIQPHHF